MNAEEKDLPIFAHDSVGVDCGPSMPTLKSGQGWAEAAKVPSAQPMEKRPAG